MDLARTIQIMGAALAHDGTDTLPRHLCDAFDQALDGDGTVLTLMVHRSHRRVLASSNTDAAGLAELEFSLGEGPGLDAAAAGTPVLVEDLAGSEGNRWPVLAAQVADRKLPVRAVFAYPLQMNAASFGFLEVHRIRPGRLDQAERGAARIAADLAGFALVQSLDAPGVGELSIPAQLADPDLDGVEVDQAVGMVMAQLRAPADVALSMLRARAFAEGRTLGAVATDVVGRRISFRTGSDGDLGG